LSEKNHGDLEIFTDGYFGMLDIEEIVITTKGDKGFFVDDKYTIRDQTKIAVFYPQNLP